MRKGRIRGSHGGAGSANLSQRAQQALRRPGQLHGIGIGLKLAPARYRRPNHRPHHGSHKQNIGAHRRERQPPGTAPLSDVELLSGGQFALEQQVGYPQEQGNCRHHGVELHVLVANVRDLVGHHGLQLALVEQQQRAARDGHHGLLRTDSGGECVRHAGFDDEELGRRQASRERQGLQQVAGFFLRGAGWAGAGLHQQLRRGRGGDRPEQQPESSHLYKGEQGHQFREQPAAARLVAFQGRAFAFDDLFPSLARFVVHIGSGRAQVRLGFADVGPGGAALRPGPHHDRAGDSVTHSPHERRQRQDGQPHNKPRLEAVHGDAPEYQPWRLEGSRGCHSTPTRIAHIFRCRPGPFTTDFG